jgi:Spy/CpxP family protein refolding chaperone
MNATVKIFAVLAAFGAPMLQAQERRAPSAEQRIARATADLPLTADQQSRIDAVASRYASLQPGDSWRLAAELEAILTDEQVGSLAEKRAACHAERRDAGEEGSRHRGKAKHRAKKVAHHLDLTEAQREQMKAQRQATRAEHEALREGLQSGAITAEQFTARVAALREQARADFESRLTPEQRQRVVDAEAQREAMQTAREAALRITPQQKAAFEAARVEAARSGERGTMRGEQAEILTEDQQQIIAVHRALAHRGHHGRRGDRGERPARRERSGREADAQ